MNHLLRDWRHARGWRFGDYIRTFSGAKFYVIDPSPDDVFITDIAHHLALLCRFNGGIKYFYSVAQHSVLVSQYVEQLEPQHALWALLHDSSEAYLGDMVRPLKHAWPLWGYRRAEARAMAVICERFHLPPHEPYVVKDVDRRICITEAAQLRTAACGDVQGARKGFDALPITIDPWPPERAEKQFLERYFQLRGQDRQVA